MLTTTKHIESGKILIKKVFDKDMWYRIPEYQRPYVWSSDHVNTLLDDLAYAAEHTPSSEYFMGSIVLHSREVAIGDVKFVENDLLDGQQRLTTIYLMLAVIRDLSDNKTRKEICAESIYQEAITDYNIPERLRIVFDIREDVQDFINEYIKPEGGTLNEEGLLRERQKSENVSVRNMANAILKIREWLTDENKLSINKLFPYLSNNVLLIYVSSKELDDAFRMFTILNDRGVKLRNSDILKAQNLKEIKDDVTRKRYAKFWEDLEGELGEDFDLFLSYIRTVLLKDKARLSLLKEFEENIYAQKSNDRPAILKKGEDTFKLIEKYKKHYDKLFGGNNHSVDSEWAFDNLITVMEETTLSDLWVPPLLAYYEHFGEQSLLEFLIALDNKFSGDWIAQESPTYRIDSMNSIIKEIEAINSLSISKDQKIKDLLSSKVFDFKKGEFIRQLSDNTVYGRRYARYILFKLDYLYGSRSEKKFIPSQVSVEHILPQNPEPSSNWFSNFTESERYDWEHLLGNLVLISKRKNASQGRLEFEEKKKKYFINNIETFPNSLRILNQYSEWNITNLRDNHYKVIADIKRHYKIYDDVPITVFLNN